MSNLNLDLIRFIGYVDGVLIGAGSLEQARQIISKESERLTGKGAKKTKGLTIDAIVSGQRMRRPSWEKGDYIYQKGGCYIGSDGKLRPLLGSDREATDWEIVE